MHCLFPPAGKGVSGKEGGGVLSCGGCFCELEGECVCVGVAGGCVSVSVCVCVCLCVCMCGSIGESARDESESLRVQGGRNSHRVTREHLALWNVDMMSTDVHR